MINEAKLVQAKYNYKTGELTVTENGQDTFFVRIPVEDAERLIRGLEHNPGSGYLHFNAFLKKWRYNEREISEDEMRQLAVKYRKMLDDDKYDKALKDDYPELR